MNYVDGYLLPVPKKHLALYRRMAKFGAKLWMEHGALEFRECIGDDLRPAFGFPFPKLMKLKAGEVPFFSFVVFKSRGHRDRVNAKVMKDPRMANMPQTMPFDVKRMAYGGFKVFVQG